MLDKEKVRLMTQLAFYEQTQGKEDFKIDEYYRKDYAGFHIICSIIWITIGFTCLAGIVAVAGLDWTLANISRSMIIMIGVAVVVVYVALVIVYAFISKYIFNRKHKRARQRVKVFRHNLGRLLKMYEKEKR